MSILALNNLLRKKSTETYTPIGCIDFLNETEEIIEGAWRQEVICTSVAGLQLAGPYRTNTTAEEVRNKLKLHFKGPGQIPFQWRVFSK